MATTARLLVFVIVLQLLTLAGQWSQGGFEQQASAQVSDPGAQRIEMIGQLKDLNGKMDQLIGILESGNLQVRVAMPDEKKE